MHVPTLENFCL